MLLPLKGLLTIAGIHIIEFRTNIHEGNAALVSTRACRHVPRRNVLLLLGTACLQALKLPVAAKNVITVH